MSEQDRLRVAGRLRPGARCPACGGGLSRWRTVAPIEAGLGAWFALARCSGCGTAYTEAPAPEDLHEQGTYRPLPPRAGPLVRGVMGLLLAERVRCLRRIRAPGVGPLIDVGAGRGGFVRAVRRAGFQATGIEPSEQGSRIALAAGLPVTRAGIEDAPIAPRSADVITLWHVLEHLDDPAQALSQVAAWLAPGGALIIAVPNLSSLQARLGGPRWFHLDVPRHRSHFTLAGLDGLLTRLGLERVHTSHVLLDNLFGMWQTLANRLTASPSYLYNLLRRNAPLRPADLLLTLGSVVLIPAAVVLELAAGAARRGGTVVIVARIQYGGPLAAEQPDGAPST